MVKKNPPSIKKQVIGDWDVPLTRAKIGHGQFLQIIYGFVVDETATETAIKSGVSLRTVNDMYQMLRLRLIRLLPPQSHSAHDTGYVEALHMSRRQKHRGWRKAAEDIHLAETYARAQASNRSRLWMMSLLLESVYNEKLERG